MQDSGRLSSAGGCAAEDWCSAAAAPLPLLPPPPRVQAQPASAQVPHPCLANKYRSEVEELTNVEEYHLTTGSALVLMPIRIRLSKADFLAVK